MVKLRRISVMEKYIRESKNLTLESQKDFDDLKAYLGDDLYNDYMQIRDKLPNLSNQFPEFIKKFGALKDWDNTQKKSLVNTYNKIIKLLPKDKISKYPPLDITKTDSLSDNQLEDLLNTYMKVRPIVFDDQKKYRDFQELKKIPIKNIEDFVSNYTSVRSKKQTAKIEGAEKLYEDSDWIVYRITTYPAAVEYGKGTKWCITGRYDGNEKEGIEFFNDYIEDYDLDGGYYFYLNKKKPSEKYCVLQDRNKVVQSIWNASDTNKGNSILKAGVDLPEIPEVNLSRPKENDILLKNLFNAVQTYSNYKDTNTISEIKKILKNGVDINVPNDDGKFILIESCALDSLSLVKLLIENGADVNVKDRYDNTPLTKICSSGNTNTIEIIKLLVKNGADVNVKDRYGNTPLIKVLYFCKSARISNVDYFLDIIKYLVKEGADVNVKNNTGDTPLSLAVWISLYVWKYNFKLVKLLIENGADVNVKDKYGNTPLTTILSFCRLVYVSNVDYFLDIIKYLVENGAVINDNDVGLCIDKRIKEYIEDLLKK